MQLLQWSMAAWIKVMPGDLYSIRTIGYVNKGFPSRVSGNRVGSVPKTGGILTARRRPRIDY